MKTKPPKNITDECYSTNESCTLNLISTFYSTNIHDGTMQIHSACKMYRVLTIKAHFSKNCGFGLKRRHLFFADFFLRFENLAAEQKMCACSC